MDKAAKSLKNFLPSLEQLQGQREKVPDEEYKWSYHIQLPKGKHCYHNTGKAAGIAKPLDSRVADFIKKLISSGYRRVKESESQSMDFVTDVLFEGVCSPDRYYGKFYPERCKIRNLITYVKMETWKYIKKMFSILYRHVKKPKFISHQGKKIFSNFFKSFCTANITWQINYISSNERLSFICLLLQTTWMALCSDVLLGN